MGLTNVFVLAAVCMAATWAMTMSIRSFALRTGLLDWPNERSSHSVPTPRGGGVAIVAILLVLIVALAAADLIESLFCIAIFGRGLLVAVVGYIDDRTPLRARWRFASHLIAAGWVLAWTGPLPPVPMLGFTIDVGAAAVVLLALYLVWAINLFNFMDGIDGIASIEAISVSLGGALVWWLVLPASNWAVPVLFAACVAGFLVWNFPPAKIFMGDAGSGFLGLVIATLSLWAAKGAPVLFWAWFILIGCFMVDATTTLLRRVIRGEKFYEAHRSHAYQYAARKHGGHRPVTLAIGALNVVWLLPIAGLVALGWLDGVVGVLIAYAPLLWLVYSYKAGDKAAQEV